MSDIGWSTSWPVSTQKRHCAAYDDARISMRAGKLAKVAGVAEQEGEGKKVGGRGSIDYLRKRKRHTG